MEVDVATDGITVLLGNEPFHVELADKAVRSLLERAALVSGDGIWHRSTESMTAGCGVVDRIPHREHFEQGRSHLTNAQFEVIATSSADPGDVVEKPQRCWVRENAVHLLSPSSRGTHFGRDDQRHVPFLEFPYPLDHDAPEFLYGFVKRVRKEPIAFRSR